MAEPQVRLLRVTKLSVSSGLLQLLLWEACEAAVRGTDWWQRLGGKGLWAEPGVREKQAVLWWWEAGGFLGVCLKAESGRQVYNLYLYLARLTAKNTSPELLVASLTAWTQAIPGLVPGLCLKVAATCQHPESSRHWEAKLLYFVRKQDSYLAYKRLQLLQDISHWASQLCNAEP